MYDVTVIGPAIIDVLASPVDLQAPVGKTRDLERIRMSFGGDALNESVVLTRLGKKVQLISKVGDDAAGNNVLSFLRDNHVGTDYVKAEKGLETAVNIAMIDQTGQRLFLMNPHSSLRKLGLPDVEEQLDKKRTAGIVCFASLFISPLFTAGDLKVLFSRIRSEGRMLVVDTTRPKNGEKLEDLKELLPYIDVFIPNDEEACALTGDPDPVRNARRLVEAGVGTAVVKTGGDGCIVASKEETILVPSVPGVHCVDTTGAGDTFAAGFLAGLCDGLPAAMCARLGCAAASCSIEEIGATDGVRSLDQVMERMKKIPENRRKQTGGSVQSASTYK